MRWIIYVFGSGLAFFCGIALIAGAMIFFVRGRGGRFATLTAVLGAALVTISGTPLPTWLNLLLGVGFVGWLAAERVEKPSAIAVRRFLRGGFAAVIAVACWIEVPYHIGPIADVQKTTTAIYVIGDSVTAGANDGEVDRWPELLQHYRTGLTVVDFARMGATTSSARRQAEQLPAAARIVILEIGGNDLLGSTTTADYESALDQLLAEVCREDRDVLMFELPLPPFRNDYGVVQRRLAAKYRVKLIPKRIFVDVLTGPGSTIDSIHLSPAGHRRMADAMWDILKPAFRKG